jgi:hypothetical protein
MLQSISRRRAPFVGVRKRLLGCLPAVDAAAENYRRCASPADRFNSDDTLFEERQDGEDQPAMPGRGIIDLLRRNGKRCAERTLIAAELPSP